MAQPGFEHFPRVAAITKYLPLRDCVWCMYFGSILTTPANDDDSEESKRVKNLVRSKRANQGRGMREDYRWHVKNFHPLLSIQLAHDMHPLHRKSRAFITLFMFLYSACVSMALDAVATWGACDSGVSADQYKRGRTWEMERDALLFVTLPLLVFGPFLQKLAMARPGDGCVGTAVECCQCMTGCCTAGAIFYLIMIGGVFVVYHLQQQARGTVWRCGDARLQGGGQFCALYFADRVATAGSFPSSAECSAACGGTAELYRTNACLWDWARFLFVTFAGFAQAQLLWFVTDAPKFYIGWRVQDDSGASAPPRWVK
eukprot:g6888.t1